MTTKFSGIRTTGIKISAQVIDPNYLWTNLNSVLSGTTTFVNSNTGVQWTPSGIGNFCAIRTVTAINGKIYCEFRNSIHPAVMPMAFGIAQIPMPNAFYNGGCYMFSGNGGCGLTVSGAYNAGTQISSSSAYAFTVGDIIGVAFDSSTGNLWFSKNGSWISGDPGLGTSPTMTVASGTYYFSYSGYSCGVSSLLFQYDIYPSAPTQTYLVPSGFSAYQP